MWDNLNPYRPLWHYNYYSALQVSMMTPLTVDMMKRPQLVSVIRCQQP